MRELLPNFSCVVNGGFENDQGPSELEQAIAQGYQQIYVLTADGIFKHHLLRSGLEGTPRYIRSKVQTIPGLKPRTYTEQMSFLPDGKISIELFDTVKAFFKEVIVRKGTAVEAMIWILWSQDKGYYLHVPDQVVSHGSANYDWSSLPTDSIIVVDIHSHANFNAFFSGTDDRDDANTIRYSAVLGHNDTDNPSFKARFNYLGSKRDVTLDEIFYRPSQETAIPEDWHDKVKTYSQVRPTGGQNYTGYQPALYHGQGFPHTQNWRHAQQSLIEDGNTSSARPTPRGPNGRYVSPFQAGINIEADEQDDSIEEGARAQKLSKRERKELRRESLERQKKLFGEQATPLVLTSEDNLRILEAECFTIDGTNYIQWRGSLLPAEEVYKMLRDSKINSGAVSEGLRTPVSKVDTIEAAFSRFMGVPHLPQDAEQRLHSAQEAELEEDSKAFLLQNIGNDGEGVDYSEVTSEVIHNHQTATRSGSSKVSVEVEMVSNYDELACNHGVDVANAVSAINAVSSELVSAPVVLKDVTYEMFQLLEDEQKLNTFRQLYELLPENAKQNLANNGL